MKTKMQIKEWEIWHTYTTYLKGALPDLYIVAKNIITSNLAEFVIHHEGLSVGRTDNGYQVGITEGKFDSSGVKADFHFRLLDDSEIKLNNFAYENWLIASKFRYSEIKLFDKNNGLPPPYIRFFLGPCVLHKENFGTINLYPMITIFESGIIVSHYRIIGNTLKIPIDDFIHQYVNLFTQDFDSIEVPSVICSLAPTAERYFKENTDTLKKRYQLIKKQKLHDAELNKIKKNVKMDDFNFTMATLTKNDENETITGLAHRIFNIINYSINKYNNKIKFIIFGQKFKVEIGNFWRSRPNVHIIRHSKQANIASENQKQNKEYFGWILARTCGWDKEKGSKYLTENLRTFEDFLVFAASAVTLFVWSKVGLLRHKESSDANRGNLIYEQQAKVEILEYGYMLHMSILSTLDDVKGFNTIIKLRKYINDLNNKMSRIGSFGEIWDFFTKAWSEMGLNELKSQISEKLKIQESVIQYKELKRTEIYSRVLTIIFGLIAIPPFANEVIKPGWLILGFWHPCQNNTNPYDLFFIGISSIIIILLIILLFKIFKQVRL
jgi:hypothetical protein